MRSKSQSFFAVFGMEQVDKVLRDGVSNYIRENNLEILGEPMFVEQGQALNLASDDDYEFKFDLALSPEFALEMNADDHVAYYDIEVTDDQVQEQVDTFARQAGHHENVDDYADGDIVRGVLAE